MKNVSYPLWLVSVLGLAALSACDHEGPEISDVSLSFRFQVNGEDLVLDEGQYLSEDGLSYQIEDVKFYVSNLVFFSGDSRFEVPNSYHLVSPEGSFVRIPDVPHLALDSLEIAIGVDSVANLSLDAPGDLNPSNQMAWNWNTGYKFVLLEGQAIQADSTLPLVFHIGRSEHYTPFSLDIPLPAEDPTEGGTPELVFTVELAELFRNPNAIRFSETSNLQAQPESSLIAENWQRNFLTLTEAYWDRLE